MINGSSIIANELNAEVYTGIRGAIFQQDSVICILKNEKYCDDLLKWKRCCTDFLKKRKIRNTGDNPEILLVTLLDRREPIFPREPFDAAQEFLEKRGKNAGEGVSIHSIIGTAAVYIAGSERKMQLTLC